MLPSQEIKELTFKDYLEIIRKRVWLFISFIALVVGFVAFNNFTAPKVYQAQASIAIERFGPEITRGIEDIYHGERKTEEYFQTQLNILRSRSLAERVVKNLKLYTDPEFKDEPDVVGRILSMMSAAPLRLSNIVVITITGENPLLITTIANAWAREFIHQDVERGSDTARYSVAWLERQLADTLKELKKAEKDLSDFVRENRIITIPDIESDKESLIEALRAEKARIEKQIAEISKRYKEKHPMMLALNTQLGRIKEQLEAETAAAIDLREKVGEYHVLKRKVDTYNSLYKDMLTRAKELSVSYELPVSAIRVIDQAEEPTSPISPNPPRSILIALAVSIFLAMALCYFMESLDSSLKTSDDVEFYVKLPFLGYISLAGGSKKEEEKTLLSNNDPHSMISESFRSIRTALLFSFPEDKPLNTIVLSSSVPGEGKSFISANLAIVFAQLDEPTLLIDADMRKGRLAKSFKIEAKAGISSLLTGIASLDEAVVPTAVPNLSFLGTGPYAPNPTELLTSKKLKELLEELKKRYKRIILDSTPLLSVSEAILLSDKCDGLIFIIRAASTSLSHIQEAKRILGEKTKIIGTILNAVELNQHYYHSYYYYRSSEAK